MSRNSGSGEPLWIHTCVHTYRRLMRNCPLVIEGTEAYLYVTGRPAERVYCTSVAWSAQTVH
jgi:hypothetical protein